MTITKQDELIAKLVDLAGGVDKLEEALREVARLTGRTPKVDEVVEYLRKKQALGQTQEEKQELEPA